MGLLENMYVFFAKLHVKPSNLEISQACARSPTPAAFPAACSHSSSLQFVLPTPEFRTPCSEYGIDSTAFNLSIKSYLSVSNQAPTREDKEVQGRSCRELQLLATQLQPRHRLHSFYTYNSLPKSHNKGNDLINK